MHSLRRLAPLCCLVLVPLLLVCDSRSASTQTAPAAPAVACNVGLEAPGPRDRGELSPAQKSAAFAEVAVASGYETYHFALKQTATQTATLQPVLLKSLAGIESDWKQYEAGWTTYHPNDHLSCDFGLLQINDWSQRALFDKQPSLRSDTRANMAAGALVLTDRWHEGLFGSLPLVNDSNPDHLINWYYALSDFNSGPLPGVWFNNPNCGSAALDCGSNYNYSKRKQSGFNWSSLGTTLLPYQERALYNMALGGHPAALQWAVGGLGLKPIVLPTDRGILPDDEVFLNAQGTSSAPNLLLFPHRARPVDTRVVRQRLVVEYALPFAAAVRLSLLRQGQELPGQSCTQAGLAGWNTLECQLSSPLRPGDVYRLRAEHGSPSDPVGWYVGQYTQDLHFVTGPQAAGLPPRAFLPIVQRSGPSNLLRNGTFVQARAEEPRWPDYWHIQTILSWEGGKNPGAVISSTYRLEPSGGLVLKASPRGQTDLYQWVQLTPGTYELQIQLAVLGTHPSSHLLIRTRPAAPGPNAWSVVEQIPMNNAGNRLKIHHLRLQGPTTFSFQANFGPTDDKTQFQINFISLTRITP